MHFLKQWQIQGTSFETCCRQPYGGHDLINFRSLRNSRWGSAGVETIVFVDVTGIEMVLTAMPSRLSLVNLPKDDVAALPASAAREYFSRNGLVLAF